MEYGNIAEAIPSKARGGSGEGRGALDPIHKIRKRRRQSISLIGLLANQHEPIGVAIREWPQQDCIEHAVRRCRRADAKRQGREREQSKAGVLAQRTDCPSQILHAALQELAAALVARVFSNAPRVAKSCESDLFRRVRGVSVLALACGFELQVMSDLSFELPVARAAHDERRDAVSKAMKP
jgi:hypothetical protein